MPKTLDAVQETKLEMVARLLVDQQRARVIVPPVQAASGFWFGGGNLIEDASGNLYLVGRYRNAGDSRTGLALGERGFELAIFRSDDRGATFRKIMQFSKSDLNVGDREVLSIEGAALRWTDRGVELFVSTEKTNIAYPHGFEDFLKTGAGVWTIDHLQADSVDLLTNARPRTILQSDDLRFVHMKDPFVYNDPDGNTILLFCTHPYCWSSSNTALAARPRGASEFGPPDLDFFPRGVTWDVAMTRGTCVLDVPRLGCFRDLQVALMFYDGGESLRNLDEHAAAVRRPRGYSCEEIGGAAYVVDGNWRDIQRLSCNQPWFISPHGTGCSRYVDIHKSSDGYFVTWQQSQPDLSQPLVMNFVSHDEVEQILA